MRHPIIVVLLLALGGTGAAQTPAQKDARKLADELTGNTPSKVASNPVCNLFGQAEVSKYLGVTVGPGEHKNAPDGIACSWRTKDYESWVAITTYNRVLPGWPKGASPLPGVGAKGYLIRHAGIWEAGADDGKHGIVVQLLGDTATEAAATSILQETMKRRNR